MYSFANFCSHKPVKLGILAIVWTLWQKQWAHQNPQTWFLSSSSKLLKKQGFLGPSFQMTFRRKAIYIIKTQDWINFPQGVLSLLKRLDLAEVHQFVSDIVYALLCQLVLSELAGILRLSCPLSFLNLVGPAQLC